MLTYIHTSRMLICIRVSRMLNKTLTLVDKNKLKLHFAYQKLALASKFSDIKNRQGLELNSRHKWLFFPSL